MFLSSGDGYVGEFLELCEGCKGHFQGLRGKVGFLLRPCSGKEPHLALRGNFPVFFSSCGRKLGVPLVLRRGSQGPAHVASRNSSLHASCKGPLGFPLQSVPSPRSSSRAEAGTSSFLSSADMYLKVPMHFQQGIQASTSVETCKSAFLSSCQSSIRLPVEIT